MIKIAALILGEDYELLKQQTPQSKRKISILGTAVLVPVIIWFFTSYIFLNTIFHFGNIQSLFYSGILAFLIFLIERSILLSTGSKWLSIFRVVLGLVISCLGSICLDEVIFKEDIMLMKVEMAKRELKSDLSENDDLKNEIASLKTVLHEKQNQVREEAQGKGSGQKGVGPITKLIMGQVISLESEILAAENKLSNALELKETKYASRVESIQSGDTDGALLDNVKALLTLIKSDSLVCGTFILFFLFFFLLEFLVIILKMTMPKSAYEEKIELIEKINYSKARKITERLTRQYNPVISDPNYRNVQHMLETLSTGIYSKS